MKKNTFFYTVLTLVLVTAGIGTQAQNTLKNGPYRFSIDRADDENIVFNTLVTDSAGQKVMYIINGTDRLKADSIVFQNDSVYIELPFFESGFVAKIGGNHNLAGDWVKRSGENERRMHFTAEFNNAKRFESKAPASFNITGRWAVDFVNSKNKVSPAIGQFVQNGSKLTGTFLTPYGDYRFLEGVVSGDSLFLSGFDGSYAQLFKAKISDKQHITGGYFSGNAPAQSWTAVLNPDAVLEGNGEATHVKEDAGPLDFSFPDMNGKMVSIKDDRFQNKVVVIQIMGSWCPNCLDETKFIMDHYDYYHKKGVEFVGLSYERTEDFDRSRKALQPFVNRFKIPYPILIPPVAVSDSLRTEKTLPQLDKIAAFPTTIFVDRSGKIRKVHSGFDGPATGENFTRYKEEFDKTIEEMLD